MIKKTFKQLKDFATTWNAMVAKNPDLERTKFGYAAIKFSRKNLDVHFREYNEELNKIRIASALTDKDTGAIMYNEAFKGEKSIGREMQYSPDGLTKVLAGEKKIDDVWDMKEIEVEPWECADMAGVDLSDLEQEVFDGLIINVAASSEKKEEPKTE